MGEQQSPINIARTVTAPDLLDQLEIGWRPDSFSVGEGPDGVRLVPRGTHTVHLSDQVYRLANLHFHRPSEHWVRGRPMQAEMHAVHLRVDDRLHVCVVAVFLDLGGEEDGSGAGGPPTEVDLPALLPDGGFHRYEGSLTTGEFTENVSWVVMRDVVAVADAGLRAFVRARADHARPVQPLNRRFVLTTG
ncbi:carbonic anhydrase family protein [Actinosynnema sp. NPDC059797]